MINEKQINSIKGLLPYTVNDSDFYYTDEAQVESFFRQLDKNHFVVLTGNTGAGKTSFVNCVFSQKFKEISGVDENWNIVHIRPGLNPIKSIGFFLSNSNFSKNALSNAFVGETMELLMDNANGLYELFDKYKIKQDAKLLLVIDPLDDLFLLTEVMQQKQRLTPEKHVDTFINLLCAFEQQCRELPVYIVISFSNSFPEKIGQYPKFLDLIEKNKFVFKGIDTEKVAEAIDAIIPENIKQLKEYDQFKAKVKGEVEDELSDTIEWLFFLQHALKQTIDKWNANKESGLCSCYTEIGGVKESLIKHAEYIYNEKIAATDKKYERIYELVFRSLIDSKGQFSPKTYGSIVEMSTRFYTEDVFTQLEKDIINPFIHVLAEKELGFLEIVRSMEEKDRVILLTNKDYIAYEDVISVRNKCLISKWPRLETFQNAKFKLIIEYEWYSRIAYEKNKSTKENYPTTLQAYALADKNRDKKEDPEEFKVIEELLSLNEAWEKANFDKNRNGFANVSDTKDYIYKGIRYWEEKAIREEKSRKGKEVRKNRIIYGVSFIILFMLVVFFPLYRIGVKNLDEMKSEYDCLLVENQRTISFIDSMQIAKLGEHAQRDKVSSDTVNELNKLTKILTKKLKSNGHALNSASVELYNISEWEFMLNIGKWEDKRDNLISTSSKLYKDILEIAIKDNNLTTVDSSAISIELWNNYMSVINMKVEDYGKLRYKRYRKVEGVNFNCVHSKDSAIYYWIECKTCKECKNCK